jgi:hypothetical protein
MDWSTHALAFAQAQRKKSLEELKEFMRFASISAQPAYSGVTATCAAWLASHLRASAWARGVVPTSVPTRLRQLAPYAEALRFSFMATTTCSLQSRSRNGARRPLIPMCVGTIFMAEARATAGTDVRSRQGDQSFLKTAGAPSQCLCLFEGEEEVGSGSQGLPHRQPDRSGGQLRGCLRHADPGS